jgi:hypothetical protein
MRKNYRRRPGQRRSRKQQHPQHVENQAAESSEIPVVIKKHLDTLHVTKMPYAAYPGTGARAGVGIIRSATRLNVASRC